MTTIRSTTLVIPLIKRREPLYLGRLTPYYVGDSEIALPSRVAALEVENGSLVGKRTKDMHDSLKKLTVNIFQAPSGRVLYAYTIDVDLPPESLVALMEDSYYENYDLTLEDGSALSLEDYIKAAIGAVANGVAWETSADAHQLLFLCPDRGGIREKLGGVELKEEFLRSLIYRVYAPLREGFTNIKFPAELNRGTGAIAAVGPFVSVLSGHQDYVENTALVSAVAILAAATEIRLIQTSLLESFGAVRERLGKLDRVQRQQMLGQISGRLAQHEMDLSQYVESCVDIGLWVPSLRIEDYHRTLAESTRLQERVAIIANSIQRLTSITAARAQALLAEEQQLQEHRRRSWALIAGLLSTVAVPLSFILAFFGVSSADVDANSSILDWRHYLGVYLFAFALIGAAGLIVAFFWFVGHPSRKRLPDIGQPPSTPDDSVKN